MAKFGKSIVSDEDTVPVATPTIPTPPPAPAPVAAAPSVTVVDINNNNNNGQSSVMAQQTVQMASVQATAQAQASVGLADVSLDKEIVENQLEKQDEHWMKAYWRPAMGWLYMLMCFCDFIAFPILSMFLPLITKLPYVAWQSLTLSNGGMIHLSMGAILGVAAYSRGQEKMKSMGQ